MKVESEFNFSITVSYKCYVLSDNSSVFIYNLGNNYIVTLYDGMHEIIWGHGLGMLEALSNAANEYTKYEGKVGDENPFQVVLELVMVERVEHI